jgi:hypothetical protein
MAVQTHSLCRRAMSEDSRYTSVVMARPDSSHHPKPWGWEIRCDGQPLPARVREVGFRTEHTAPMSGKVALRDFLSGLAQEQSKNVFDV